MKLSDLAIKIFADGADLAGMLEMYREPFIKGFTTNPTLMRKAGIADYRAFAQAVLAAIPDRPISFEVFSDEFDEMERRRARSPPGASTSTSRSRSPTRAESLRTIWSAGCRTAGVKLNVTAVMTLEQVRDVVGGAPGGAPSIVSVFAGRIADTGRDPVPLMAEALEILKAAAARRADLGEPARAAQHLPGDTRSAATSSRSPTTS